MKKKITLVAAAAIAVSAVLAGCGTDENTSVIPEITVPNGASAGDTITAEAEKTEMITEIKTEAQDTETSAPETEAKTEETAVSSETENKPATAEEKQETQKQTEAPAPSAPEEQTEAPKTEAETEPPAPEKSTEPFYTDGVLIVNKTYSLSSDYVPSGLVKIGWDDEVGYVTAETGEAFKEMQAAAAAEGLNLYLASGYRSYSLQSNLYNRYVSRDGKAAADTYSARPGHSEHQTGLAFDLNTIDDSFAYTAEGKWVAEHCYEYGFIIRYPAGKEDKTGYIYEPWHLRYLGVGLATDVYNTGLCLEEYFGLTSEYAD